MNDEKIINQQTETATLASGCFWCTEAIFQQLYGVISVNSGYAGGETENPEYRTVCTGTTGHAECLQIIFDPTKISFEELLEIFWKTHDPTTLNRQGNDIGSQYRSTIFYNNEEQKLAAEKYIIQLSAASSFPRPVVTTLEPLSHFYPAESYHRNYFNLNRNAPYCQVVIKPKVEKFLKNFAEKIKI